MLSGNTKSNGLLPWDILNAPNENKDVLVVPIHWAMLLHSSSDNL